MKFDWEEFMNVNNRMCKIEEESINFLKSCDEHVIKYGIPFKNYEDRIAYLEWSDYMNKEFKFDDIEVGMVIEVLYGRKFLKINNNSFVSENGVWITSFDNYDSDSALNIIKIYDCREILGNVDIIINNANESNLIWDMGKIIPIRSNFCPEKN